MERKQFTFYSGFMDGIKRIKTKSARCDAYDAIIAYALDGTEPDLDKLPDAAAIAFVMARPNLDASRKRAANALNRTNIEQESNEHRTSIEPTSKPKQEKEEDKEKEKVKEQLLKENTKEKRTVFKAPTVEAVAAYIREKGYPIDAQHFVDYYQRQGWKLSNGQPMKDWQSAVRLWSRDKKPKKNSPEYFGKGPIDAAATRANYERLLAEEESA